MTMAHSIEARPPLLDHRLVEFAAKIPARLAPARRHHEVPAQAGDARHSARRHHRSARSRGLPCRSRAGSAASCSASRATSCCRTRAASAGFFDVRLRRAAAAAEPARPRSRSAPLDDSVVRALVPPFPRRARSRAAEGGMRDARRHCRGKPRHSRRTGSPGADPRAVASPGRQSTRALVPINPRFPPALRWIRRLPYVANAR